MSDDTNEIIQESERSGLTVSIFSVSLNIKLTYFFMTAAARDQALARWRSKNVEIIDEKEETPMTKDEAVKAAIEYMQARQQLLLTENNDIDNRYDVLPVYEIDRQRQNLLEINRLSTICKGLAS